MPDKKELHRYVEDCLDKGVSHKVITQNLLEAGWREKEIQKTFQNVLNLEKGKYDPLLFFIATFLLGILFFSLIHKTRIPEVLPPTAENILSFENKLSDFSYGEQPALSRFDFFNTTKEKFIESGISFIEADLSAMRIRFYKNKAVALDLPINSKGREGSWWETPAGIYKINSKEDKHFSGMGHVWMPWSMNFQGNFYIHGHPYYPNGSPTPAQYTGGCIRLSTEDAKQLYNLVEAGMPLLVYKESFSNDNFTYQHQSKDINATAYLSGDLRNNQIFISNGSTNNIPIASITKLMTALVATEYINIDKTVTVPREAIVFTSKARLLEGETYKVYDLLFPLLMESSNEAAEVIARDFGRSLFIKRMNEKALAIGMKNTHFADPSGASAENTSTPEDLFMLAKYIYNNRSFVFNITSGKIKTSAYGSNPFSDINNFNNFVKNKYFFGGKNGKTTAAKETNLSLFELPVSSSTRPVVFIVLGAENAENETARLINATIGDFSNLGSFTLEK